MARAIHFGGLDLSSPYRNTFDDTLPDAPNVVEYGDGEVRQQSPPASPAWLSGAKPHQSEESSDVGFSTAQAIKAMEVHPSIRLPVEHFFARRAEPDIG